MADKGYHEADQLEKCDKAGLETFVPEPGTASGRGRNGETIFAKEQFRYEAAADVYHCPGQQVLKHGTESQSRGKDRIIYYNRKACKTCTLKSQYTTAAYRTIARRTNEAVEERAALRVTARPDLVARRKEIVEHVFGTLRNWHHGSFLMRTLEKVQTEFSLSALVYNLRRVVNLVRLKELKQAV